MTYEGPPDWQQQPGRWQQPQPAWPPQPPAWPPHQPGWPPTGWPQHGYGQVGYPPPPPAGYVGYGYPKPVRRAPRVAPLWTGAVVSGAGLAAVIGSFMTWAKASAFGSSRAIAGTDGNWDGKLTVVFGAILLAMGLLILFRQGRLWTGIVSTASATLCTLTALVDIGDISDRSDEAEPFRHIDVGSGLLLVLAAAITALAGAIVAICVRRVSGS